MNFMRQIAVPAVLDVDDKEIMDRGLGKMRRNKKNTGPTHIRDILFRIVSFTKGCGPIIATTQAYDGVPYETLETDGVAKTDMLLALLNEYTTMFYNGAVTVISTDIAATSRIQTFWRGVPFYSPTQHFAELITVLTSQRNEEILERGELPEMPADPRPTGGPQITAALQQSGVWDYKAPTRLVPRRKLQHWLGERDNVIRDLLDLRVGAREEDLFGRDPQAIHGKSGSKAYRGSFWASYCTLHPKARRSESANRIAGHREFAEMMKTVGDTLRPGHFVAEEPPAKPRVAMRFNSIQQCRLAYRTPGVPTLQSLGIAETHLEPKPTEENLQLRRVLVVAFSVQTELAKFVCTLENKLTGGLQWGDTERAFVVSEVVVVTPGPELLLHVAGPGSMTAMEFHHRYPLQQQRELTNKVRRYLLRARGRNCFIVGRRLGALFAAIGIAYPAYMAFDLDTHPGAKAYLQMLRRTRHKEIPEALLGENSLYGADLRWFAALATGNDEPTLELYNEGRDLLCEALFLAKLTRALWPTLKAHSLYQAKDPVNQTQLIGHGYTLGTTLAMDPNITGLYSDPSERYEKVPEVFQRLTETCVHSASISFPAEQQQWPNFAVVQRLNEQLQTLKLPELPMTGTALFDLRRPLQPPERAIDFLTIATMPARVYPEEIALMLRNYWNGASATTVDELRKKLIPRMCAEYRRAREETAAAVQKRWLCAAYLGFADGALPLEPALQRHYLHEWRQEFADLIDGIPQPVPHLQTSAGGPPAARTKSIPKVVSTATLLKQQAQTGGKKRAAETAVTPPVPQVPRVSPTPQIQQLPEDVPTDLPQLARKVRTEYEWGKAAAVGSLLRELGKKYADHKQDLVVNHQQVPEGIARCTDIAQMAATLYDERLIVTMCEFLQQSGVDLHEEGEVTTVTDLEYVAERGNLIKDSKSTGILLAGELRKHGYVNMLRLWNLLIKPGVDTNNALRDWFLRGGREKYAATIPEGERRAAEPQAPPATSVTLHLRPPTLSAPTLLTRDEAREHALGKLGREPTAGEVDEFRRKESIRRLQRLVAEGNPLLTAAERAGSPTAMATATVDKALRQEAMEQPFMVPAVTPSQTTSQRPGSASSTDTVPLAIVEGASSRAATPAPRPQTGSSTTALQTSPRQNAPAAASADSTRRAPEGESPRTPRTPAPTNTSSASPN